MRTVRLRIFFATMSAGQPTKLSTTKRSPFDAEMELLEVPRSIPTWRICDVAIPLCSFLLLRAGTPGVLVNAIEQRLGDLLPVVGAPEHRRFAIVGKAAHLGQYRGHVSRHQNDERRPLHAPVFQTPIDDSKIRVELLLDRGGQSMRLIAAHIGVDTLEKLAEIGDGVSRDIVFRGGQP